MIENGTQFNPFQNTKGPEETPLTLKSVKEIVIRQRFIILGFTILFSILAGAYAFLTDPVYEAKTVVKKEVPNGKNQPLDEFARIVSAQTAFDDIETEAALIKSRTVLEDVIQHLDLYFMMDRIDVPNVLSYTFEQPLAVYANELARFPESGAPRVYVDSFLAPTGFREIASDAYFIKVNEYQGFELHHAESEEMIEANPAGPNVTFTLPLAQFSIEWPNPVPGSLLYFSLNNLEDTYQALNKSISINNPINTSLLEVYVQSNSSYLAYHIANILTDTFRQTRFDHKKETIQYSSGFVDSQLAEVSEKLGTAEAALSDFRGRYQLTDVETSTQTVIDFLNELEAEKISVDLELSEVRTRLNNLKGQVTEQEYFDQTYLTPTQETNNVTPFASLLSQLSDAEIERLELLQRRTENHPDVIAIDDRIAEIKASLADFNQSTIRSYEIIIASLEEKQSELVGLINQYSTKARTLAQSEDELMQLIRDRDLYEKMYLLLTDKREEMRLAEYSNVQDIILVEAAVMPQEPILPQKKIYILLGLILGLMAGVTVALIREFNSSTITKLSDVEDDLMIPILAILPTIPRQIRERVRRDNTLLNNMDLLTDTKHGFKESYRMLRTKLSFVLSTKRSATKNNLLFTSCEENTGKTTVVSSFSLLLSLAGKRILLIDCDLKNPSVGRFFDIPFNAPGLIDFLNYDYITTPDIYTPLEDPTFRDTALLNPRLRMEHEEVALQRQAYTLDVIPAGGSVDHSSELLDSDKFKEYLQEISHAYDYVLIDTPPVTRTVDALTIGNYVKNAILIVRPSYTRKDNLQRAIHDFRQFNVHLLGSVINACDIKRFAHDYGYGYGYGYSYQYDSNQRQLAAPVTT